MSLMCFQRGRSWKRGIVKPQDLTLLGLCWVSYGPGAAVVLLGFVEAALFIPLSARYRLKHAFVKFLYFFPQLAYSFIHTAPRRHHSRTKLHTSPGGRGSAFLLCYPRPDIKLSP